jgi:NTP pyrophosphatase (non-canonical NTP hydrolase)
MSCLARAERVALAAACLCALRIRTGMSAATAASDIHTPMQIAEFQKRIADIYIERDKSRGAARNFAWLVEEVGELSRALRQDDRANLEDEFADVLAWLVSLASVVGVDIQTVAERRYGRGCPKCTSVPCACD